MKFVSPSSPMKTGVGLPSLALVTYAVRALCFVRNQIGFVRNQLRRSNDTPMEAHPDDGDAAPPLTVGPRVPAKKLRDQLSLAQTWLTLLKHVRCVRCHDAWGAPLSTLSTIVSSGSLPAVWLVLVPVQVE